MADKVNIKRMNHLPKIVFWLNKKVKRLEELLLDIYLKKWQEKQQKKQ